MPDLWLIHGGAIGAMLHAFLRRPDQGAFTWRVRIGNTGMCRLRVDGRSVVLDAVNDLAHLEGGSLTRPPGVESLAVACFPT